MKNIFIPHDEEEESDEDEWGLDDEEERLEKEW